MFSSALKSFSSNISSQYQIAPEPTLVSGPWKIHDGKKKSTGTPASIFIFDRKALDSRSAGFGSRSSVPLKKLQDGVVERLKREASNLARLRHPSILQMLEPLEEARNGSLMFATEHITASLAGLLQEKDEQESGPRSSRYIVEEPDGTRRRRHVEIDELEIQKGLLQIAKGLEFLHESASLVHGNFNPEVIYINAKSDWKISGLAFAGPPDHSSTQSTLPPLALSEVLYPDPRLPGSVQLNLNYTSPDFALDSSVTTTADLFSLGLVIIAIYNSPHVSPIQSHSNVVTYKKLLSSPSTTPSAKNSFLCKKQIPKDLLHVLPRLITLQPAQRLTAREFQESQYFDNVLISTIRFLESLPAKTPSEKSQFMRGLHRVLPEFPVSVLERKVLVALLDEMKDKELLSLILQNVFKILKRLPNGRRVLPEVIIPRLKEIFLTSGSKGQGQERDTSRDAGHMVILENMDVIAENCPGKEFKEDILPIIQLGMESPTHSLVDAAMRCLPAMLPVLDFTTVKNEVFPPIASTFGRTSSLSVKIRGLEAFVVLCGGSVRDMTESEGGLSGVIEEKNSRPVTSSILDKYTVQEKLVPLLKAIKTKEPSVMMATLNVFRQVGRIADTDFLALEVLPILWGYSLGPLLNLLQFQQFMEVIDSLSTKIEREQTKKLQELSSRDESAGGTSDVQDFLGTNEVAASDLDAVKRDFERLVLGRNGSSNVKSDGPWDDWRPGPSASKVPSVVTPLAFSWSSSSAHTAHRSTLGMPNAIASQPDQASRSITPDLGVFPSLEPMNKRSSMGPASPPLQPTAASWNSVSMNNQPILQKPDLNPPLTASGGVSASTPLSTSGVIRTQRVSNYSAFTIPPPPSINHQKPQATVIQSSLNPWTAGTAQLSLQNDPPAQPPSQQKQGLDKYESLL